MNYIELINRFWALDENWQFTCGETRLYFYLLKTANCLGWPSNWAHSDAKTSANVGVSADSLKKARGRLVQAGLISFEKGGNGQGDKGRYQILLPKGYPKRQTKYGEINETQKSESKLILSACANDDEPSSCDKTDLSVSEKKKTDERRTEFYAELEAFADRYPPEMLRKFGDYWSETNKSCTRMRFETERTWELGRRLAVWAARDKEFASARATATPAKESVYARNTKILNSIMNEG